MITTETPEKKRIVTGYGIVAFFLILSLIAASLSTSVPNLKVARRYKAANTTTQIQAAYLGYYTEYGEWPQSSDDIGLIRILEGNNPRKIEFLSLRPTDRDNQGRVVDPWGTPYRIKIDSDSKIHATSAGPDKVFGTPDDIINQ